MATWMLYFLFFLLKYFVFEQQEQKQPLLQPRLVLPFGHTAGVNSAHFSPDGKRIATASWDHTTKIWDAASGKLLQDFNGHTHWVWSAKFSPDGKYIVTASDLSFFKNVDNPFNIVFLIIEKQ